MRLVVRGPVEADELAAILAVLEMQNAAVAPNEEPPRISAWRAAGRVYDS
jgi:hypothetical protein